MQIILKDFNFVLKLLQVVGFDILFLWESHTIYRSSYIFGDGNLDFLLIKVELLKVVGGNYK